MSVPAEAFDNPFFTREVRQLARRPRAVQASILVCLGLMVAIVVLWFGYGSNSTSPAAATTRPTTGSVMLWLLVAVHTLLCMIAAGYGGYRLFAAEHFRSTLEIVLLLPYSPLRWLWLKSTFPLVLLLIAWSIGLPFFMLAVLGNLLQPSDLPAVLQKQLMAGVAVLGTALFVTPDIIERVKRAQAQAAVTGKRQDIEVAIFSFMLMIFWYAFSGGLMAGSGLTRAPRSFYQLVLPEYMFWVVGGLAFLLGAVITGSAALVSNDRKMRMARLSWRVTLAIIYYMGLGFIWGWTSGWVRWIYILGLPFFLLITLRQGERRDDGRAEREVEWVAARWDNPLLVHDLRVYTRFASIRLCLMWSIGTVLVTPFVLKGLELSLGTGTVLNAMVFGVCQGLVQAMLSVWFRPKMLWSKELAAQTLPLLLLTPLSSAEILAGRLMAVPIYHGAGMAPLMLIPIATLAWLAWLGYWIATPVAIALCPLFLSVGIWLCCNVGRSEILSRKVLIGDFITILLRVLQSVVLAACVVLGIAGLPVSASLGLSVSPLLVWVFGFLLCGSNAALAWAWFCLRVRQLDELRQRDIEMPTTITPEK